MTDVKIYHKPTCSTSRAGVKHLTDKGVKFDIIKYHDKPFTKNELKALLKKMGIKAEDLLRKREAAYKELDFKNKKYTEAEIIEFMVNDPSLIQRPIIVKGDKAVIARPTEKINEIIL